MSQGPRSRAFRAASSARLLTKGGSVVRGGATFAHKSVEAWAAYHQGIFLSSHALVTEKGYGPLRWLKDSASLGVDAWFGAFDAWTSLFAGMCQPCCGSGSLNLTFDADSEMAGPAFVELPQAQLGSPIPTGLTLNASTYAPTDIPLIKVKPRYTGTTLALTLVNLKPLVPGLIPGSYSGTITVGAIVVPVTATYTGPCVDDSTVESGCSPCPTCGRSTSSCGCPCCGCK